MTISISTFRVRFPEFPVTLVTDERVQLFLNDTILHIGEDETRWMGRYDYVQAYLAAHLLKVSIDTETGDSSTKAGVITSRGSSGVSTSAKINNADRSDSDDFYISTSYGQQFLLTRRQCFPGVLVTG